MSVGKGSFYKALIARAHPKHCEVTIEESWKQEDLWPFYVHIAVAPTKNMDRMEWFAEKACEIGINEITCLNCRFSERKEVKPARLEKILVSAMKQSEKPLIKDIYHPGENALILIGPEGDFSPEEIQCALENGFEAISLGKSRLRTETAALTACHTLHVLNQ